MTDVQFWIYMLMVAASPLIAVQVTELLGRRRARRERRIQILRTLLTTRAARVSSDHVQALNMIDLEFYGKDSASMSVIEAWKIYIGHLNDKTLSPDVWVSRGNDLFMGLLRAMTRSL
jgi:hypothetical protein